MSEARNYKRKFVFCRFGPPSYQYLIYYFVSFITSCQLIVDPTAVWGDTCRTTVLGKGESEALSLDLTWTWADFSLMFYILGFYIKFYLKKWFHLLIFWKSWILDNVLHRAINKNFQNCRIQHVWCFWEAGSW